MFYEPNRHNDDCDDKGRQIRHLRDTQGTFCRLCLSLTSQIGGVYKSENINPTLIYAFYHHVQCSVRQTMHFVWAVNLAHDSEWHPLL